MTSVAGPSARDGVGPFQHSGSEFPGKLPQMRNPVIETPSCIVSTECRGLNNENRVLEVSFTIIIVRNPQNPILNIKKP